MPLIHYKMASFTNKNAIHPTSTVDYSRAELTESTPEVKSYIPFLYPSMTSYPSFLEDKDLFDHQHDMYHKRDDKEESIESVITRHTPSLSFTASRSGISKWKPITRIVRSSSIVMRQSIIPTTSMESLVTNDMSTPVVSINKNSPKNVLRSLIKTKVVTISYNPDSTKFKTITHTSYYSTQITPTRSSTIRPIFNRTRHTNPYSFGSRFVT